MKTKENSSIVISILLGLFLFSCSKTTDKEGSATLVVTGNVHSQLDPCGWKRNPTGGLPRKATFINKLRNDGMNPIILDAGDLFFDKEKYFYFWFYYFLFMFYMVYIILK